MDPRKVVHVPKVVQQERQHHFHVEEIVDVPAEQHVEQVVHVPVVSLLAALKLTWEVLCKATVGLHGFKCPYFWVKNRWLAARVRSRRTHHPQPSRFGGHKGTKKFLNFWRWSGIHTNQPDIKSYLTMPQYIILNLSLVFESCFGDSSQNLSSKHIFFSIFFASACRLQKS